MQENKVRVVEIEFEVFGQVHHAYAELFDIDKIEASVLAINSTCHIEGFRTVLIDRDLFIEKNIEKVNEWVNNINNLSEEIQETI